MKDATPAERELAFRIHALCFVVVLPVLAVVNYLTGRPYWILWVVLGWGIGLLAHWLFGVRLAGNPSRQAG